MGTGTFGLMDTGHKSIVRVEFRDLCTHASAAMPMSPCTPVAVSAQTLGPLSVLLRVCPAWTLSETTSRYPILLNTPVGTLNSILLVIERQSPAYSERGEINLFCAFDSKDPITLTATDCHTTITVCHRHTAAVAQQSTDSTSSLSYPRHSDVAAHERYTSEQYLPPTLVAERASAPLLLRTWLRSLTVHRLNDLRGR